MKYCSILVAIVNDDDANTGQINLGMFIILVVR